MSELEQVEQQLVEVRAAISAALLAKSTQVSTSTGGRRIERAELADLTARETALLQRAAKLRRGTGPRVSLVVPA